MINYNDFFYLDESSPSGLRWKVNRYGGKNLSNLLVKEGDVAGTMCLINKSKPQCWKVKLNRKQMKVKLNRKQMKVHRIIWVLTYGEISDTLVINHKDTNPFNNKIDNLELVTIACNSQRQSKHAIDGKVDIRNKSGINGIFKFSQENRTYVRAVISIPKSKDIVKSIRIHNEDDERRAYTSLTEWRKSKIEELVNTGILFYRLDQHDN